MLGCIRKLENYDIKIDGSMYNESCKRLQSYHKLNDLDNNIFMNETENCTNIEI